MAEPTNIRRRAFVARLTVGVGATAIWPACRALAQNAPHLDVQDPAARVVGYVENVTYLDRKKYPEYADGSLCGNCLQLQGTAGPAFRPCTLFKDKVVAVSGWCSGWTPEI